MYSRNIHKSIPTSFAGILTVLTILSGLLLMSPHTSAANTGTLNAEVTITATCSLTVSNSNLSATIDPNSTGQIGTYSTVKTICNDPSGLAVYAVGYTNDTYGNNNLTQTVGNVAYDIPSDIDGSPTSSQWNMTIAKVAGDYEPTIVTAGAQVIPQQYTKVAYRNSMTDIGTGATGANFTATFNAYVSATQAAGTYTGKVKFLLVHPNVLTYDDQTGEPATFAPNIYVPPMSFDEAYESANKTKSNGYYKLQDMSSTICNSVTLGEVGTLIDTRDNQTYTVRKLKMSADGSQSACWMSNLNLGAQAFASGVTQLDSTNTHLASGVSPISTTTFNSWNKTTATQPDEAEENYHWINPEFVVVTTDNSSNGSATDVYGNKYGTHYNYAAVSAGTYIFPIREGTGNATSDLCPAGWRLPTGGNSGEFTKLAIDGYAVYDNANWVWNTDGIIITESTLGFSRAGYSSSEYGARDQGTQSTYWTSTIVDGYAMDVLFYDQGDLFATGLAYRDSIYSVRCIAQ